MTYSFRPRAMALAGLLTCTTWSLGASAQYETLETKDEGYEVHFQDGDLLGDSSSATGYVLRLRHKVPRVLLIRARTSFVREVIHSVEDM